MLSHTATRKCSLRPSELDARHVFGLYRSLRPTFGDAGHAGDFQKGLGPSVDCHNAPDFHISWVSNGGPANFTFVGCPGKQREPNASPSGELAEAPSGVRHDSRLTPVRILSQAASIAVASCRIFDVTQLAVAHYIMR